MQYGQFSPQERPGSTPPPVFSPEPAPAPTPVVASYRELRRARAAADQRWKVEDGRKGVLGAWLALTAPAPASALASLTERERLRKAELSAYVLFGILLMGLVLIPNGLANQPTLLAALIIVASAVLAAVLNRANRTMGAALLLIGAFSVALGAALVTAPNLDLMWLPAIDFFAVPVLLAGLLLNRWAPFVAALLGSAAVVALFEMKPRGADLAAMIAQLGVVHFIVRPVSLMLVVAIASWLWSRSVEHAIRRADRAEEVAAMEHQLAEQKRQLDRGIQNLLETHVRVANGDFSARAATAQDNVLWQIAVSLNNLLSRLGKYAHIEQRLQHTEHEIDRLAGALETAQAGHTPAWPVSSGTRVDRLLATLTGQPAHPRGHAPTSSAAPKAPEIPDLFTPPTVRMPGRAERGGSRAWEPSSTPPITGQWRAMPDRARSEHTTANGAEPEAERLHTSGTPGRPIESINGVRRAPFAGTGGTTRPAGQDPASGTPVAGSVPAWLFPQAPSQGSSRGSFQPPARPQTPGQHNGWHAPSAQRRSAPPPPSHWAMQPLPPLPPVSQAHTAPGTTDASGGAHPRGQAEPAAPNGSDASNASGAADVHANGHGTAPGAPYRPLPYGFSESFPGQLQRPAAAEPSRPFVVGPVAERTQREQRAGEAEQTLSMPAMEGTSEPRGHERGQNAGQGDGLGQDGETSWPDWPVFPRSLDDPAE